MAKVIGSPYEIDDGEGSILDADAVAAVLECRMEERFPDHSWTAVQGGEASGDWNLLVNGNHYETPTEEEQEFADKVLNNLVCEDNSYWVVRPASSIARNPDTPPEVLAELVENEYDDVRQSVAWNPTTPAEVLEELAHDEHPSVRHAVTENPNVSADFDPR